jgi:hypothetical protein
VSISVVVPVYNSESTLRDLVDGIAAALEDETYEVLLVDDASADGSWREVQKLASEVPEVTGVRLARNVGEQNAVLCGISRAGNDTIVTIDDDLQQPPAAIPELLSCLSDEGHDLVYGVAARYEHGVGRQVAAAVTKRLLEHVFRVPGASSVTSFRAFRARLRDPFPSSPGPLCSVDALLSASTTKIGHVEVDHVARRSGRSQYTPAKLVAHTMSAIVGGSASPLLFATVAGLLCLVAAAAGVVAVAVDRIVGGSAVAAEWLLVSVAAGLFGLVLVALGILGEYAARILLRVGGYPAFVVAESTDDAT